MAGRIVNPREIRPDEIQPGDQMLVIVKAMVSPEDDDGLLRYRIYKCPYPWEREGIPQGSHVPEMEKVCELLFPSLALVGKPD